MFVFRTQNVCEYTKKRVQLCTIKYTKCLDDV